MPRSAPGDVSEPFAIVGVSFKLPQDAVDETSLWEVLKSGKNLMTAWPEDRVKVDSFNNGGESGKPNNVCLSFTLNVTCLYPFFSFCVLYS